MVMRNREIALPECKTLQRLIFKMPLLSLHCHFNDVNLLKWVQSLTSPKAIRVSLPFLTPTAASGSAESPQTTED